MPSHHNYQLVQDIDLTHLTLTFNAYHAGKDDMHHVSISSKKGDEEGPIFIQLPGVLINNSPYESTGSFNVTIKPNEATILQEIESTIKSKAVDHLKKGNKADLATRLEQADFKDRVFGENQTTILQTI